MSHIEDRIETKSFWLKCWRETSSRDTVGVWRFSLENPRTGKRLGFASLESLFIHMKSILSTDMQEEEGNMDK